MNLNLSSQIILEVPVSGSIPIRDLMNLNLGRLVLRSSREGFQSLLGI